MITSLYVAVTGGSSTAGVARARADVAVMNVAAAALRASSPWPPWPSSSHPPSSPREWRASDISIA